MSLKSPFNGNMKSLFLIVFLGVLMTSCKNGGGGTIYTDLCQDHPTNCVVPPEDAQRGGPIDNDDVVPPFVPEELEFYTHNDIQDLIRAASDGDTIFIDKDIVLRSFIIIDKEITLKKSPSVDKVTIKVINTEAFSVSADNFNLQDFFVEMENSSIFINTEIDFGANEFLAENIVAQNLYVSVDGTSQFRIDGKNFTLKNSTIVGELDLGVDFYMSQFFGEGFTLEGNIFIDKKRGYKGAVFVGNSEDVVINSNIIVGHVLPGYNASLAVSYGDNFSVENNVIQDSNTSRQNTNADPDDEFNNSASLGFEQTNGITDNGFVNKYASYRFIISDLAIIPAQSSNVVFGASVQIPVFTVNSILNNDGSINCNLGSNPAVFISNDFNNLREIENSGSYIPGSDLIPDNCL